MSAATNQAPQNTAVFFSHTDLPFQLKGYAIFRTSPTQLVVVCRPPFLRIGEAYVLEMNSPSEGVPAVRRPTQVVDASGLTDSDSGLLQIAIKLRYWVTDDLETDDDAHRAVTLHRVKKAGPLIMGIVHKTEGTDVLVMIAYEAFKPQSKGLLAFAGMTADAVIERAFVDKDTGGKPRLNLVLNVDGADRFAITPQEQVLDEDDTLRGIRPPCVAQMGRRQSMFSVPPEAGLQNVTSSQTDLVHEEGLPEAGDEEPPSGSEQNQAEQEGSLLTEVMQKYVDDLTHQQPAATSEEKDLFTKEDLAKAKLARRNKMRWLVAAIFASIGVFFAIVIGVQGFVAEDTDQPSAPVYQSLTVPMNAHNLAVLFHQQNTHCFGGNVNIAPKPGFLGIDCASTPPYDLVNKCSDVSRCKIQVPDGEAGKPGEHPASDELLQRWFHQQSAASYMPPVYPFATTENDAEALHVDYSGKPFDPVAASYDVRRSTIFVPEYDTYPPDK